MTKKNLKYFNYAKNMALMSDFRKCKIGCVIVSGNKILSAGFNSNRTHPIQQFYNRYREIGGNTIEHKLHGEISALLHIRDMELDWSRVDLYTYRIYKGKDKKFGSSRPCMSCMQMIKDVGIKNIYYTTDDGYCHEFIA